MTWTPDPGALRGRVAGATVIGWAAAASPSRPTISMRARQRLPLPRSPQGHELNPHGATAVALTPGWLRSEMMLENFGVTEGNWREAAGARAPALATDPARKSPGAAFGRAWTTTADQAVR